MEDQRKGIYIALKGRRKITKKFLDMIVSMTGANRTDYVIDLIESRIVEVFSGVPDIYTVLESLFPGHADSYKEMEQRVLSGKQEQTAPKENSPKEFDEEDNNLYENSPSTS